MPIKQQPHRTPIVQRDRIKQMVDQMQKQGIVQPSKSPWASPVVSVPKKDGSLRFCVDYCKLNSITRKDVNPLPRVDDNIIWYPQWSSLLYVCRPCFGLLAGGAQWACTWEVCIHHLPWPVWVCSNAVWALQCPATFQWVMQAVLAGLM